MDDEFGLSLRTVGVKSNFSRIGLVASYASHLMLILTVVLLREMILHCFDLFQSAAGYT